MPDRPLTAALRRATLAVLMAVAAGCDQFGPTARDDGITDDLDVAQARWRSAGLTSYRYVHGVSCFCAYVGPALVTVRSGQVVQVVSRTDNTEMPVTSRQGIDSLFAFVRQELQRDPAHLVVTYDAALGYPRTVKWGTPENDGGGYISADSVVAQR